MGLSISAFAREDIIPGSRYTSGRAAAMGDAYLPLGDDPASGLFYNPADLGKIRKAVFEPINYSIYASSSYLSMMGLNFFQVTSLSSYQATLDSNKRQLAGVGGAILPNFGFPGLAFGILMQSQLAAQANSQGSITYKSLYQFIPTLGTGFRLFDGVVRLGYSLQWVNEAIGTPTVPGDTSPLGYNQGLAQGSGFSHTVGVAITAPIRLLPSVNLVARNVFNTQYNSNSLISFTSTSTGAPATEPMTFDGSFSITPVLGQGVAMNLVLEDRDITNQSGDAFLGHLAIGTEFIFQSGIFLRGGWGDGYPSAGFGMKRPGAEIALTWYTEEIGGSYMSVGDSRFMLQYQMRTF